MLSPVSGLGRLFNPLPSASFQNIKSLNQYDSIAEESVTYDLLYPDLNTLHEFQHQIHPIHHGDPHAAASAAKSADDRGGLDVQASTDVRLLVAQKVSDSHAVLFDTHPPSPHTTRTSPPPTSGGNSQTKENRVFGGFGNSRRLQQARTVPHSRQTSQSQKHDNSPTKSSGLSNFEYGSIFGGSQNQSSTARPTTSDGENAHTRIVREEREETEDILGCMFGAPGFASATSTKIHAKPCIPRTPPISRPNSPENEPPVTFRSSRSGLFRSTTAESLTSLASSAGVSEGQLARRTSAYVLITRLFSVDLTDDIKQTTNQLGDESKMQSRRHSQTDPGRNLGHRGRARTPVFAVSVVIYLPNRQLTAFPASPRRTKPGEASPQRGGAASFYSRAPLARADRHLDQRIEQLLDRSGFILRALASFEVYVQTQVKDLLFRQQSEQHAHFQRALRLNTSILQECKTTRKAADACSKRTSLALRIRQVITGQDRWALWRGVTRSVGVVSAGHDMSPFLLRLITGFLASHAEWLAALAPHWYRQLHRQQLHGFTKDTDGLPSRTVVVSLDKMAARRMIFLLSAFLPFNASTQHQILGALETSVRNHPMSDSPDQRTAELRRRSSHQPSSKPVALPRDDSYGPKTPVEEDHSHPNWTHNRRPSDTGSIRSLAMPITSAGTRKSSTTTTTTIMPSRMDYPVPRFATPSPEFNDLRPGSSGSLAALSLQRTLSRSDSNEVSNVSAGSQGKEWWGSVRSGFWSSRRNSSTENSEIMTSSGEGLGIGGLRQPKHGVDKLSKMVEDAKLSGSSDEARTLRGETLASAQEDNRFAGHVPSSSTPEPEPLTLSYDKDDRVIDVQCSPSKTNSISSASPFSSFDSHHAQESHIPQPNASPSLNQASSTAVAGWLRAFHPDFALQAVRPYDTLKQDIKQAMLNELAPSNFANNPDSDEWTTACTTVVADTATLTVTRLTLRRRNSPQLEDSSTSQKLKDQDYQFLEHPITHPDSTLSEAIEKALAHPSYDTSAAPTPGSTPPPRSNPHIPATNKPPSANFHSGPAPDLARNAETRHIVLGALARMAREVANELEDGQQNGGEDGGEGEAPKEVGQGRREKESLLREEVRRWMQSVRTSALG